MFCATKRILPSENKMYCPRNVLKIFGKHVEHFKVVLRRNASQASGNDLIFSYLDGKHSGVAVIGLNRPKQKNAFSVNLVKELNNALDRLQYDSVARVLVVRSLVPGIFCAGADLKERSQMTENDVPKFVAELRRTLQRVYEVRIPVVMAIDGAALGGGLELALAGDIRVASSDAKMGLVETKLAIIPGAGGTQRLPRLINPSIAKELIFTAKVFPGEKAKELGICNHAVQQNANGDAAFLKSLEIAEEIVPNGPVALRMAKAAIDKGVELDLNSGLSVEEFCYSQVVPTKDRIEGLQAFKEKRKPNYVGQ